MLFSFPRVDFVEVGGVHIYFGFECERVAFFLLRRKGLGMTECGLVGFYSYARMICLNVYFVTFLRAQKSNQKRAPTELT